ncbi:hypothetical protein JZ751_016221, partial [Albula glossodonta]
TEHSETELQTCLLNWCNGPARHKSKCLLTQRLPSKKYTLINLNMSWTEAQHYCQQNHTGLAIINTTEDMTAALKVVEKEGQNMGPVWICLHREKREQYGHKCTVSEKLKWVHIDCNTGTRYMCQRVCTLPGNTILKIYTIHDDLKTQKDAEKDCCEKGGHLASILNEEEKKKFDEIDLKPDKDVLVWIGLKWSEEAKLWKWSSGDIFQNWTNELLPNSDKNCMVLEEKEKNLWNEDKCMEKIPFLCYDDLPYINPTSAPISACKSTSPSTTTATATSASGDSTTSQKTATTMETTPHDLTATSTSSSPSTSAPTQILTTIPQKTSTHISINRHFYQYYHNINQPTCVYYHNINQPTCVYYHNINQPTCVYYHNINQPTYVYYHNINQPTYVYYHKNNFPRRWDFYIFNCCFSTGDTKQFYHLKCEPILFTCY